LILAAAAGAAGCADSILTAKRSRAWGVNVFSSSADVAVEAEIIFTLETISETVLTLRAARAN